MRQDQISAYRGSGFRKSRGQRVGQLDGETPEVAKRDVLLSGAAVSRFHISAYRGSDILGILKTKVVSELDSVCILQAEEARGERVL
jgi:hypothetical protein